MNFMKKISLGILLLALFALGVKPASSAKALAALAPKASTPKSLPSLNLNGTALQQGNFFIATVHNSKKKPTVWFNGIAYRSYELGPNTYRALIPIENLTKPGSYAVKAKAGSWEQKIPVTVKDNHKKIQYITLSPSKDEVRASSKEMRAINKLLGTKSKDKLWDGKFMYPNNARKSSVFGSKRAYRTDPNAKPPVTSYHKGLDFAAQHGSPVLAPADGKVVITGTEDGGFYIHGGCVGLDHGHGVDSIYMHLSKVLVKKGDFVKKGQKIGEVGSTGISTGPHLHWGVYINGTSVDPEYFVNSNII